MLVCETVVPDPKDRFTYAARNISQAHTERRRFGLSQLPVHVWEWSDSNEPELLGEFDL